jgi:predicted aldo/keto reductase-like oxidoreductase
MHDVRTKAQIAQILGPGGAMEAFEAATKAGKCRFIGFTGHFNPETHAALLKAYPKWDSVLMPVHRGRPRVSQLRKKTALPVVVEMGIGIHAIKVFYKAVLLRALNPQECLRYTLSMPVHVAICGFGTTGQMEDNVRVAQSFKPLS